MRPPLVKTIISLVFTIALTVVLAIPLGPLPALGPLLSPVGGLWSAARDGRFGDEEHLGFTGVKENVTIVRDNFGVPHIFAQSDEDAAFALGWLHARERLAQMDLQRRNASGTLAELVGPDAVEDDKFMRDIGLRRAAQATLAAMPADDPALKAMQAYADGVNAYLEKIAPNNLPLEYKLLGVHGVAGWTVLDELTFAKFMAIGRGPHPRPLSHGETRVDLAIHDILSRAASAGQLRHPGDWRGSNNWAVSGARTASGKPLLASDPHLGYQLPSLWYAAHIVTPTQDVYGVTLVGMPAVIIGHTRNVAWGLTNTQADVIDFFAEKIDPDNANQYWHDGAWQDVETVDEAINVRGGAAVHHPVRITAHGPILTQHGVTVAMQWTGSGPTFEARALFNLNHAENYDQFVEAVRDFQVPAQNFAYADTAGNIAIWSAGKYPIRKSGDGRTVADGATGERDWVGFVPLEAVPHAINPERGYLLSANQRPAPANYPYALGWQWDPSYRARRIEQTLSAGHALTVADMQALQFDSKDTLAESLLPVMLPVIAPDVARSYGGPSSSALTELTKWDYRMATDSIAATIWARWAETFRRMTWADEWKAAGFEFDAEGKMLKDWGAWGFNGDNEYQPPLELWEWMVREKPDSPFFDDASTPGKVETRDDLIRPSFAAAIDSLVADYGSDTASWRWGDHHKLE
ncbi:MAG: penicillin acylase family protein, partial [Chloroflexi bacterium]|nr:penicillin acylase family protein [Chloroflexota bacterium]